MHHKQGTHADRDPNLDSSSVREEGMGTDLPTVCSISSEHIGH